MEPTMPCIVCGESWTSHFTGKPQAFFCHKHWHLLPVKVRSEWWTFTDYSRREPSAETLVKVYNLLKQQEQQSE